MSKKTISLSLVAVFSTGVILFSPAIVSPAHAAGFGFLTNSSWFSGLITSIAQKFGLDKTQVQQAVTDYQSQHPRPTPKAWPTPNPQSMQNREKTYLDKLVSQGKITNTQETAILSEYASLQAKYNLANLSPSQRQSQMQAMLSDFTSWAQSQNIDPHLILPMGGMGRGGMMHRGMWHTPTTTPTPTLGS